MTRSLPAGRSARPRPAAACPRTWPATLALLAAMLPATAVHATDITTDIDGLSLRWDNTLRYSNAWRTRGPSAALTGCAWCANADDGDRNFGRGLISNRVDLLSEFDLAYHDVGLRVSGAAWYDSVYRQGTDHDSAATFNPVSVSSGRFTDATARLHGRDAEILDAFVYVKGELGGDHPYLLRAGRHTLVFGEAMFFGANGITAAQAPTDVVKAMSVPNATAKELAMPVGQVSGQVTLDEQFTLSGYVQYEWRASRLPGVGSYFSMDDFRGVGGERRLQPPVPFTRGQDLEASDSGQYGVQLKYNAQSLDTDFGLYHLRYHDKTPRLYNYVPPVRQYAMVYPEGIDVFGLSFSRNVGAAAVAGEASVRHHMPLVGGGNAVAAGVQADNADHALYAVGRTAHLLLNGTLPLPRGDFWHGGFLMGELAWNRRLSVDRNPAALHPGADRDAWGLRVLMAPSYQQVLPRLDLSVPVGLSYFPKGRSSAVGNFGVHHGGTYNLGLQGTYDTVWRLSLTYTGFYGPEDTFADAAGLATFKQALKDRDHLSFSLQRSF
ncbi:DUF1302 domain-containing protein [Ideonella livida]|uniref:DUF1302 domain-containing protein n=1 Tax=Ideonella livida TaxID=2707176 RepID=A0A7C9TJ55_9BURK|nr:DUF1302 family protein [Ideonella livida]NDY91801.1 DUF1302 domain-containing protein [Ideonella livida]